MQFTESFIDTVNAAWANKNGHTVNVSKYACTDTHRPFHLCVALTMRFERCLSHSLNSFIFNKILFCVNWLSDLFYTVHIITWFCKFEQKKTTTDNGILVQNDCDTTSSGSIFQTTKDRYIERNETHTWRNNSVGFFFQFSHSNWHNCSNK